VHPEGITGTKQFTSQIWIRILEGQHVTSPTPPPSKLGTFQKAAQKQLRWPLEDITETDRADNLNKALTFGNHKGASSNPEHLLLLMSNDLFCGFAIPFPLEKMTNIPGILFAPLNIQEQNTINNTSRIVPSKQPTHNQSYQWTSSGTSVNSSTRKASLLPCIYGRAVCRLVNWEVTAPQKYPTT
jgi:hypothetical protein